MVGRVATLHRCSSSHQRLLLARHGSKVAHAYASGRGFQNLAHNWVQQNHMLNSNPDPFNPSIDNSFWKKRSFHHHRIEYFFPAKSPVMLKHFLNSLHIPLPACNLDTDFQEASVCFCPSSYITNKYWIFCTLLGSDACILQVKFGGI